MLNKTQKGIFLIKLVLWFLVGIFILLGGYFIVPAPKRALFPYVVIFGLIFLLLGVWLISLTIKQRIKDNLKIFLVSTGVFAICPFVFSILHNVFYALAVISSQIVILKYAMEFLDGLFFILALLVSPVGFLISVIVSLVSLAK